jgi:hypothetical protein
MDGSLSAGLIWSIRAKRYIVAAVASAPLAWFGIGYLLTL